MCASAVVGGRRGGHDPGVLGEDVAELRRLAVDDRAQPLDDGRVGVAQVAGRFQEDVQHGGTGVHRDVDRTLVTGDVDLHAHLAALQATRGWLVRCWYRGP